MVERILKIVVQFCCIGLASMLLFYLFFVKGLEWHEQAILKQQKPPIELRR